MIEQRILFDAINDAEGLLLYGDGTLPDPIGILNAVPVEPKYKEIVCVRCGNGSVRGTLYKTGENQYEHDHGKAKRNWKRAKWVLR